MELTKTQKKRLVKLYKKLERKHNPCIPTDKRILIHYADGDFEHTRHIWLLACNDQKEATEILDDYPIHGLDFNSPYDCTGRPFCAPAIFKKVADNRYLVRLLVQYDV